LALKFDLEGNIVLRSLEGLQAGRASLGFRGVVINITLVDHCFV
jgi:hypothetical protein